ncbi:NADPH--hemoprotein reductase [Saccharomycopsis crataegensis]|uniref:NADPH--cytochrome P450 reductase n=1 Tax=Saccharomycopsis crataegensis TaxID=43959 RepID=A0AAV5QVG7_9ASCO|nr:NADPH--hemoprotein reductase [Saccharomycopsis crataegensis]
MPFSLDKTDCGILSSILAILVTFILAKGKIFGTGNKEDVSASSKSRNIVEVIEECDKKAVVIYASQTGTAEDYATKFGREFQSRFQLSTLVADSDDYDLDNLNEIPEDVLVFFFISSYGEGELPDSATEFNEYLDTIDEGDLQNLNYTIFGLGNSTYEFYNGAAKKVDKDLIKAGATKFVPYGDGDDGAGTLDEDFLAWKEKTFETLKNTLSLKEVEAKYQPAVSVVESAELFSSSDDVFLGEHHRAYLVEDHAKLNLGPFDHSFPYLAPVTKSKELFISQTRHCIHAEFDLSGSNLKYSTGDHLAILPPNSNEEVDNFLKAFGLLEKRNQVVVIKPLDTTSSHSFPSPTTFDSIARYYLEITGAVSRQFLGSISEFAPSQQVKDLATKLSKDKDLFHKEITSKKFNISDALLYLSQDAPWTTVPNSFIVDSVPNLQPRFYSISSSSISEKTTIHVTAVVEAETAPTADKKYVTGVTTNLLHSLEVNQNAKNDQLYATYDLDGPRGKFSATKLPVFVRRSNFKLPTNPALPIILVGPGTGVAPLRGFVRERVAMAKMGTKIGKVILFFGSRRSDEDYLYKEEWVEYAKILGENFEIVTAFSRETSEKVYVQHKMLEKSKELVELIDQKAFIYVCGDASNMARSVQGALATVLSKEKGITEDAAAETLRKYKSINRYQEDVW